MNNSTQPHRKYSKRDSNAHKQIILDNPFHPLDLSAHDLLTVYKKFDVSREANRNPKQELPIETIAQLISSLKGCKPSYIQKCMSLALIKDSISWNQFLAFLDQESEVRYKVLDWLMHEKAIIKYRFQREIPFRAKILNYYENISLIQFVNIGEQNFMLLSIDHKEIILTKLSENKIQRVDTFQHKNTKQNEQNEQKLENQSQFQQLRQSVDRTYTKKTKTQMKQRVMSLKNRSMMRSQNNMLASDSEQTYNKLQNSTISKGSTDEEVFFKKERKNIHAIFSLFTQLPLEQSRRVAKFAAQRIQNRTINGSHVNQIKQTYEGIVMDKKADSKAMSRQQDKPIEAAHKKLQSLYQQKALLSYNPYKSYRITMMSSDHQQSGFSNNPKKINHDRKQKEYLLEAIYEKFCPQLNCVGIVFHNLELCLIKIAREYNKIVLEEQDSLKIVVEKDFKKNIIIQMIDFYCHRTTNKWFVMVLFRSQHKQQVRGQNQSFIKGYEIELMQGLRKGQTRCVFAKKKEVFVIDIGKNQIIKLLSQKDYGLHLISHNGKYFTWKQDYRTVDKQTVYFKKDYQQKFKGSPLSLSCISINSNLNKAILGTVKGMIVVYDLFSKQYKIKKIFNCPILQIQTQDQQAFILGESQKIIIWDIIRHQEVQNLNVKNQQKLHQKVSKFVLSEGKIVCYGSCIRVFEKFVDENLQQQKFKMENIYTWRLNKLDKSKGVNNQLKVIPSFRKQKTNAELLFRSQNYFIVLTEIQQAIFYAVNTMQVKFTTILDIPHDEKVMKITVSQDEKLLGVLLFNQNIYVFNIFTQELILSQRSTPYQKYTSISFLDRKNQYLLAAGTESGKIILLPLQSVPQKQQKILQFHSKPISLTTLNGEQLITSSQNQQMVIWQLPYNILKHEIKLKDKILPNDYVSDKLGRHLDSSFFRTQLGVVIEISTSKGEIKSICKEFKHLSFLAIDAMVGYMFGVLKAGQICVFERKNDKQGWVEKRKFAVDSKQQIVGVGIVQSEKVIFFTKTGMYIWLYRNDRISKFKSFLQCIV